MMTPLLTLAFCLAAADDRTVAERLRGLDPVVLATDKDKAKDLAQLLSRDVRERLQAANRHETEGWRTIRTRADWEKYRDPRIAALRAAVADFPKAPDKVEVRVTGRIEGDGYRIENVVYQSRPGLWVTANLYQPAKPGKAMPALVIVHSHHNPKTQGELQDMGMTWARLGCVVLVPDMPGHGERRTHPFADAKAYPKQFNPGRQDYWFRYYTGMQLAALGDSLTGWMAWDLMRGIDVLLARPGVDKDRVVLLGSVAGGGDPVAVTAALDPRIAAVVPFNFGGPQPETRYPLPADAEDSFNYAGGGSWESTRNLRRSASDGFLPWVIVGSVAPRGLIYGHEFSWDGDRDPVWARLKKIYAFHNSDRYAVAHGKGTLTGNSPQDTHCNNIGPEHRKGIYPPLKKWFDLASPEKEASDRRPARDLLCLTAEAVKEIKPRGIVEVAAALADERLARSQKRLGELSVEKRREALRHEWAKLLGGVEAKDGPKVTHVGKTNEGGFAVEKLTVHVERGIAVPCVLLVPEAKEKDRRAAVVVALSQDGKQRFLKERSAALAELLKAGVAVCLPDVRGTGETRPGDGRARNGASTGLSSSEQMLGGTLLGARLRDVSAVLSYLGSRPDLDRERVALWGESFAAPLPADRDPAAPLDAPDLPGVGEPLGGLLALFGGLYHDRVRAVAARGCLAGYRSLLDTPFVYIPHDAVVPGAIAAGDLPLVIGALAPKPVRLEGLIDGCNRRLSADAAAKVVKGAKGVVTATDYGPEEKLATWLAEQLGR